MDMEHAETRNAGCIMTQRKDAAHAGCVGEINNISPQIKELDKQVT